MLVMTLVTYLFFSLFSSLALHDCKFSQDLPLIFMLELFIPRHEKNKVCNFGLFYLVFA